MINRTAISCMAQNVVMLFFALHTQAALFDHTNSLLLACCGSYEGRYRTVSVINFDTVRQLNGDVVSFIIEKSGGRRCSFIIFRACHHVLTLFGCGTTTVVILLLVITCLVHNQCFLT